MAPPAKNRPLPKFGEWDVNDPSSAEGFTDIFNRAREEKRSNENAAGTRQRIKNDNNSSKKPYKDNNRYHSRSKSKIKWLCCFGPEGVA